MSKKKITYTEKNIAIWQEANEKSIRVLGEKIRAGDNSELYSLSRAHEYLGLTLVARGSFSRALGHFGAASEVWASLLERYVAGETIARELVEQGAPFVLANAGGNKSIIERLAEVSSRAFGDECSRNPKLYFSVMITRALSLGDVESASELLASCPNAQQWPSAAVIEHDEQRFAEHMRRFADLWSEIVQSERLHRLPDAVCDISEIGWIKLAEKVWGKRPEIDLEPGRIPKEIFEVEPELIDPGI